MREFDQWSELKPIRRPQRRDVARAVVAVGGQRPAPGPIEEYIRINRGQVLIRHDPRPASVAVGKGVDPDQLVVKACGGFQRLVGAVLAPIAGIVHAGAHLGRDVPDRHANVLLRQAIDTRPIPDLAEQPLVDRAGSIVGQDVEGLGPPVQPGQPLNYVFSLQLVQFAARRDVLGHEAKQLVGRQGGRTGGFVQFQGHFQKSLGISRAISPASSSIISS